MSEGRIGSEAEYRAHVARRALLARTALGLTQDEAAEKAGETRNFVSSVERMTIGLDAWRLGLLADALEVPLPWLLSRSAEPVRIAPPPR